MKADTKRTDRRTERDEGGYKTETVSNVVTFLIAH